MRHLRHHVKNLNSFYHHTTSIGKGNTSYSSSIILFTRSYIIFWAPLIAATVLALVTSTPPEHIIAINDKILHFIMFMYLTLAWAWIDRGKKSPYRIATTLFLHGLLIEWIQHFLPSRTCSLADMAANGLGSVVSLIIIKTFQRTRSKKREPSSRDSDSNKTSGSSEKPHSVVA